MNFLPSMTPRKEVKLFFCCIIKLGCPSPSQNDDTVIIWNCQIMRDFVFQVVNYLLKKLGLSYHRHIISERYSCGTRRKLSTALALIGQPQILLLVTTSTSSTPVHSAHSQFIITALTFPICPSASTSISFWFKATLLFHHLAPVVL